MMYETDYSVTGTSRAVTEAAQRVCECRSALGTAGSPVTMMQWASVVMTGGRGESLDIVRRSTSLLQRLWGSGHGRRARAHLSLVNFTVSSAARMASCTGTRHGVSMGTVPVTASPGRNSSDHNESWSQRDLITAGPDHKES